MEFEWDDAKDERTLKLRGIGFDDGARIFEGRIVAEPDARTDYGEVGIKATGMANGRLLSVVYTDRGDRRRIISVRVANRKERQAWLSHA